MRATRLLLALVGAVFLALTGSQAQSPVVIQAASTEPAANKGVAGATSEQPTSLSVAIEMLKQMKAADASLLQQQEATLQQLDQVAADHQKIFSKRD